MQKKSVLIVGLFKRKNTNNRTYTTAANQLAALLNKYQIPVITTSFYAQKLLRLIDSIYTIIINKNNFSIAVVPLYGTKSAFFLQEIISRLIKLFNKKLVIIVHGGSIPERMKMNATPFLKALRRANLVVCPSNFFHHFLQKYNLQTSLIPNVLNLSEYPFQHKEKLRPHIFWMRAFEDVYNPQMAVRVASLLQKKYPNFKMIMAGSNKGLLPEIKLLIKKNNLENKIFLPGYINMQQKLEYVKEYDIFINTNRVDNAPVSLIEFMALGLPVVSVNSGGIPDIIQNGENGLLTELDDDDAMVQQVESLLNNSSFAKQIICNAYKYSRQYDEPVIFEKWKNVFNTLEE